MNYVYLISAVMAEVIATSALKYLSDGVRVLPLLTVIGGYGFAFACLTLLMKTMPVGVVYALWSGLGTALIVLVGAFMFKQVPDFWSVLGIGFIVAGVLCINVLSKTAVH